MKRKTLYNFNSVQLTFNQCVLNRIQYTTEHNLYSTRLDKVDRMKSSTTSIQFNTAWTMETQIVYNEKLFFPLSTFHFHFPLSTFHFSGNEKGRNDPSIRVLLPLTKRWSVGRSRPLKLTVQDSNTAVQALIIQTSAVKSLRQESDARMGKVTRGGQFSVAFSGRGFPWTYPGHPPRPIDGHRGNRSFYRISEPIYYRILVYLRACVFLRLMLINGRRTI